jgi:sugar phosphate isomerase/epimerase
MKPTVTADSKRRAFLKSIAIVPALASARISPGGAWPLEGEMNDPAEANRGVKLSLNAYSFNDQLLNGNMTLEDMLRFCAEQGLVAADLTGYYFAGYPNVPPDEYLYNVKRTAFRLGVEISGTGVRNDFTHADPAKRRESVQLVKNWIDAAEKLGAQTIRIFSGNKNPEGYSRQQVLDWMYTDIRECIEYGKSHGVVIALQNHNDFIKTSAETIEIMEALRSDWFGLMLDIGSFRAANPYDEIARTIKYAITWQVKEKVFVDGKEVDVDTDKLAAIIRQSGYRGYLPVEALGKGDAKAKVSALVAKLRKSFSRV